MKNKLGFLSLGLIFSLISCCLIIFNSPNTSAAVYSASISAAQSVTMDLSMNKEADVKVDNVVVDSTCPLGYTLTISGPNDANLYKGGDDTAGSIDASGGTSANPSTILGEGYLNTWGYSLASGTTINSSTFIGLSNTTNTLADKQSASASGGDTVPVYYGASISGDKEPGAYVMADNGTIVYSLVANAGCGDFEIVYNGNNDDGDTAMGMTHTNIQEDDDVTLYASNYIREGYGFAGWSTVQLDPDNANFQANLQTAVSAGKVYGPNETITTDATFLRQAQNVGGANIITLYAIWVPSAGNIQGWTGCPAMSVGDITALKDTRDNDIYAVAKLADGNCWMIENLRLDNTASHNTDGTLAQGYGGLFAGLASSENSDSFYYDASYVIANSIYYSGTPSGTASVDIGTTDYPIYRMPRYNNVNTSARATNPTSGDDNIYSYGNYYNWPAAIADTTYYGTNNQSVTSTSICPTGWRLPRGGDKNNEANNDFWALWVEGLNSGVKPANYNSTSYPYYSGGENPTPSNVIRSYPNNFVYSGMFSDDSETSSDPLYRGGGGYLWSSTAANVSQRAYRMNIDTQDTIYPGTHGQSKTLGISVRCIMDPIYTITYNANGGTGTMAQTHTDVSNGDEITLYASNFSRSNYGFAGWSFDPNAQPGGNSKIYGPNETITVPADIPGDSNGIATLYAVWVESTGNIQGWTGCPAMSVGDVTALKDTRDNDVYAVAKLADGSCWMIENLRLDAADSSDSSKAQGFGGVFSGLATSESANFINSTTANSKYSTSNITGSNQGYRFPRYNNDNTNNRATNPTDGDANIYSYGNYYNWPAAIANTTHNGTNNQSTSTTSICPAGWKLPQGGNDTVASTSDFRQLSVAVVGSQPNETWTTGRSRYGNYDGSNIGTNASKAMRAFPNNFIYSGGYYDVSMYSRGSNGIFWSSTTSTSSDGQGTDAYRISIADDGLNPATGSGGKFRGVSVRCIKN